MKRLIKNRKLIIEYCTFLIIGIIVFLFAGQEWVRTDADAASYINSASGEGVMPLYPLFIEILRVIFGKKVLLSVVVIMQSIIAAVVTTDFSLFIKEKFNLGLVEEILVYFFSMLPYLIYLPEYGITHWIMTEGVSYSLFYIFFKYSLKYIFDYNKIDFLKAFLVAIFMGLTRSQLSLSIVFLSAVVVISKFAVNKNQKSKVSQKIGLFFLDLLIGTAICVVGIISIFGFRKLYNNYLYSIVYGHYASSCEVASIDSGLEDIVIEKLAYSGQPNSLLKIKAFYEAEPEDVELFDDENERELFSLIYDALDEHEYLHKYADGGLYGWIHLTQDRIPLVENDIENLYFSTHTDTGLDSWTVGTHMALTLLKKHWPRVMLHSMRIMLMSLVASVFFQIEAIYFWCHVIAISLYLSLIFFIIWQKKRDRNLYKISLLTLGFLLTLVVVTNLALNGVQRYVVYAMGVFYISLYLNIRSFITKKESI